MVEHRGRSRWPFWVGVTLVVVAGLLWIAQDQETLRVESPVEASDPRFTEYVAALVGAPVAVGNTYTLLRNGDGAYPPMLAAVAAAKSRIVFESYVYKDGVIGDKFIAGLEAAAQRGVSVKIVFDSVGASLADANLQRLKSAGVEIRFFNPLHFWQLEDTNYRTHRKLLVVDGQVAFIGGMGVADHWLGNAQDPLHWRDTQFQVTGSAVRALDAGFYENWLESGGQVAPALDPELPASTTAAPSIVLWSNPTGGASNIKMLYLLSIASARKTIDIHSPYVTLDPSTRWALSEARRRGVRVRILSEGENTDAMPVKHAIRYEYQRLLEEGFEIAEYQPTMLHVKAVVVDGIFSLVGSANFGNRSFEVNDEITVAVADAEFAASLVSDFENDLQRSTRLDLATWPGQRSIVGKFKEWFWSFFGELF